jgi:hypothetical protein
MPPDRARALCIEAVSALPGLRLQHWDTALSDAGPVMLEADVERSMDLRQLATARGVWGPEPPEPMPSARQR